MCRLAMQKKQTMGSLCGEITIQNDPWTRFTSNLTAAVTAKGVAHLLSVEGRRRRRRRRGIGQKRRRRRLRSKNCSSRKSQFFSVALAERDQLATTMMMQDIWETQTVGRARGWMLLLLMEGRKGGFNSPGFKEIESSLLVVLAAKIR